jgi:hypothetical protein
VSWPDSHESLYDWWRWESTKDLLHDRIEQRCRTASGLFAMDAGRTKRSLSQRFRRIREEEIAALRERQNRRRFSLTDPRIVKLWASKLLLQAMKPTIFERFYERRESGSGPKG